MGLLDDAIREHLELKRLRGADPGEVAREQREVLTERPAAEPDLQEGTAAEHVHAGSEHQAEHLPESPPLAESSPGAGQPVRAPQLPPASEANHVIQETAEIDMRAVLEEEGEWPAETGTVNRPITGRGRAAEDDDMEASSMEWEVPGEDAAGRSAEGRQSHEPSMEFDG